MGEKNPVESVMFYKKTDLKKNPENNVYQLTELENVSKLIQRVPHTDS